MKLGLLMALCLFSSLVFGKSSREERATKDFELTYQFGQDYRMISNQIGAMFFLDANNQMGFKVGESTEDDTRQTNVSFQYKHYLGNSFYVSAEVFYLNTLDDENWIASLFLNKEEYARYSSMGAGLRIGNQWTWKFATLGIDWVGIGQRIGVFSRDYKDSEKTTFTLFNVIAGFSF